MEGPTLNTLFDVLDIFQAINGYKPAYVSPVPEATAAAPLAAIQSIVPKITNLYGEPLYGQADMLGAEVFCPVTIEGTGRNGQLKNFYLPYCVVGIDRSKTVVFTEMTELGGSVKEIISNRDYDITIKGFLIGQYGAFPDQELADLNELFEYNGTVRLKSAFTDIFLHENDTVLILRLSIPQKPKVIGVRDFSLQAVSDGIFTLYQN